MEPLKYLSKAGEFSTQLAIGSFAIGTLLLVAQQLFPQEINIILCGLCYVILAFVLNLIVFLYLLYYCLVHREYREYFAIKMLIMLANVPIAVCYFLITINQIL